MEKRCPETLMGKRFVGKGARSCRTNLAPVRAVKSTRSAMVHPVQVPCPVDVSKSYDLVSFFAGLIFLAYDCLYSKTQ